MFVYVRCYALFECVRVRLLASRIQPSFTFNRLEPVYAYKQVVLTRIHMNERSLSTMFSINECVLQLAREILVCMCRYLCRMEIVRHHTFANTKGGAFVFD